MYSQIPISDISPEIIDAENVLPKCGVPHPEHGILCTKDKGHGEKHRAGIRGLAHGMVFEW